MHVHDIPDPAAQEAIHRLWDELADFEVGQTDAAVRHLKSALCGMVDAWNATWAGAMRLGDGKDGDPLQGWRVTTTRVLHPFEPDPQGPFEELQERWNEREMDPSFLLPMRGIGAFRTYGHRRDMPAQWFDGPVYQAFRGIKWFHRQIMLTHGPLIAKAPLTPTERKVLALLLTKASEKQIADQLGLAASTTHQHVVALFRKFGVRSRAGLMSLWLK